MVYAPIAHWLWHPDGWLAKLGTQDWAGGMVVHASAGAAVLAVLLVVGRRRAGRTTAAPPNSIPLTILGAGILWFGWFGFNGGDGLQANGIAAQAVINTHLAAAAGMLRLAAGGTAQGRPQHRGGRRLRRGRGARDDHPVPPGTSTRSPPSRSARSPASSATSRCG